MSNSKRTKAAYVVKSVIENILEEDQTAKIIVMGDFNDNPVDQSLREGLNSNGKTKKYKSRSSI